MKFRTAITATANAAALWLSAWPALLPLALCTRVVVTA